MGVYSRTLYYHLSIIHTHVCMNKYYAEVKDCGNYVDNIEINKYTRK